MVKFPKESNFPKSGVCTHSFVTKIRLPRLIQRLEHLMKTWLFFSESLTSAWGKQGPTPLIPLRKELDSSKVIIPAVSDEP